MVIQSGASQSTTPEEMVDYLIPLAVVLTTSVWVAVDAHRKRIPSGKNQYSDNDPYMYFFCCMALWIIAYPYYLFHRNGTLKARNTAHGTNEQEQASRGG
jgi:hypothetical protein